MTFDPREMRLGWLEYLARTQSPDETAGLACCTLETIEQRGVPFERWHTVRVGFRAFGDPYKSGPRKGQRRVLKEPRVDVIVDARDGPRAKEEWSSRTGHCAECLGTGKRVAGWSSETGARLRPCRECDGSGRFAAQDGATS